MKDNNETATYASYYFAEEPIEEFKIGDIVHFAGENRDEFDRLSDQPKTPLTIVRVGSSKTSFDYEVVSPSGNHFFLKSDEIEEC
jgi:hypothetical protein